MYCEECKVKIEGKTSVCPLCHKPVVNDTEKTAFPVPAPKRRVNSYFAFIYAIAFIVVIIPLIAINVYYNKDFMWSIMVLAVLVYIFFLVRYTILTQSHFRQRLIGQTAILTFVFFVVRIVTGTNDWIVIAWLPALYITSDLILASHLVKYSRYAKKNVIATYILGLLGVIPTISAYIFDLPVKIPSYVASGFGLILIAVMSIVFRKNIISEVKKFFHI